MTGRTKFLALLPLAFLIAGPTGEKPFLVDAQDVEVRFVPMAPPRAGPIPRPKVGGYTQVQYRGHFEVRAPNPGEPSISSLGGGGGCLIAQDRSEAKPCHSDNDCNNFPKRVARMPSGAVYDPTDRPGRYGYCVRSSVEHGTCWWKPSYDNCTIPARGPGKWPFSGLAAVQAPAGAAAKLRRLSTRTPRRWANLATKTKSPDTHVAT